MVREKDCQAAHHSSPEDPAKLTRTVAGATLNVHWPVTYPLFIICCEILLEQISLAFPQGYH